jgi:hypothetical protein
VDPKISDQGAQRRSNPPPWTPKAAAQIARLAREQRAGRPAPLFVNCLPEGMPSWMLITHNALEFARAGRRVKLTETCAKWCLEFACRTARGTSGTPSACR